jgi:hypothetical protein
MKTHHYNYGSDAGPTCGRVPKSVANMTTDWAEVTCKRCLQRKTSAEQLYDRLVPPSTSDFCVKCDQHLSEYCRACYGQDRATLDEKRVLLEMEWDEASIRALHKERQRLREHVATLREALKDYYHACICRRPEMDAINLAARRALHQTEKLP